MNRVFARLTAAIAALPLLGACSGAPNGPGTTASAPASATASEPAGGGAEALRFVFVPKTEHPWFEVVRDGALAQAEVLSAQIGVAVIVEYRPPGVAVVEKQNALLKDVAATQPDGIALDPLDFDANWPVIQEIQAKGITVVLFDSPAPEGSGLTSVGNDFAEQARLASVALAELLDWQGKVAVMAGVLTAPNHFQRYETHLATLAGYPGIEVVDGGVSQDSIAIAYEQAAAVIAATPDLRGYLCVDAACPIGVSRAIEDAGKVGEIQIVGMDNLEEILRFIESGTMAATSSTKPQLQGAMALQMLWLGSLGVELPALVDTGIVFIDQSNVGEWLQ